MIRTSLALLCLACPANAERFHAQARCTPTEMPLHYACEIRLMRAGDTVENAAFTIKPDMPSMPMAHNIPPVAARATETPGLYAADVRIDMLGDWTLTLDLSAPRRDRVVVPYHFAAKPDAGPTTDRSSPGTQGPGNHTNHSH